MRKNTPNLSQFNRAERSQGKRPVRLISLPVILGALALLMAISESGQSYLIFGTASTSHITANQSSQLRSIDALHRPSEKLNALVQRSGLSSLIPAKNASPKILCIIPILLCPDPTSNPTPSPTSESNLTPSPTSTPNPQPLPTATPTPSTVSSPTATASTSPTKASSTGAEQKLGSSPTSIPAVTKRGNTGHQTLNPLRGSGFSRIMAIVAVTFLCLLLILGISLFILRRRLLPPIVVKTPRSD